MLLDRRPFYCYHIIKNYDDFSVRKLLLYPSAILITALLPRKWWYWAAYYCAYAISFFLRKGMYNISQRYTRAERLNTLLALITRCRKAYYIPISIKGFEHCSHPDSGLLLCTVHIPLLKVAIGKMLDNDVHIDAAIAAIPGPNNTMSFWGTTKQVAAILSDSKVLLKVKSILQNNGTVTLMVDRYYGKPISPNIFHLAAKTGTKLAYVLIELLPNGQLVAKVIPPPHTICTDEASVNENIAALKHEMDSLVGRYKS